MSIKERGRVTGTAEKTFLRLVAGCTAYVAIFVT